MTSFSISKQDPSLLVVKGNFESSLSPIKSKLSDERDSLIIERRNGADSDVVNLTSQIFDLEHKIEKDQMFMKKQHIHKLSKALVPTIQKCGHAKLRAVGSNAISNAVLAIAKFTKNNPDMLINISISIETGNIGNLRRSDHSDKVEAVLFLITGESK